MTSDAPDMEDLLRNRDALELELMSPGLVRDQKAYAAAARRLSELSAVLEAGRELEKIDGEIRGARLLLGDQDPEMRALAQAELDELSARREAADGKLKVLLLPRDPNDDKNTIVEIRAGTGGDEAGLFAADMFRMYARYADSQKWRVEIMSSSPNTVGGAGFKEIVFSVEGERVYSHLKYESGVHRVQRVPNTETQGRIHTSTVTVAVLPEAEDVEVDLRPEDVRVDVFRSSGPGGQSVNTTDSAVRVTHLPTGLVVSCQDEKSQLKNKQKALKVLRARLLDKAGADQARKISDERREQVGTGDRSERIRTYNYPQGRVTDHRVGLTLYRLQEIMDGGLQDVVAQIGSFHQARQLAASGPGNV
ncbi:MAG: peptide chain release factor 1 [Deltaproteobacteria bacterium]|jgi:peptide chain release factor 1|nr:peptide chain release factor 1 [Deltaproteobacteria bacterium]